MGPLLLACSVLLCCFSVQAGQTSTEEIDIQIRELEEKIATGPEDQRHRFSLELAQLLVRSDPRRASALTTDILQKVDLETDLRFAADAHKTAGLAHLSMNQNGECLTSMKKAESLFRELGEDLEAAKCLGYQGIVQGNLGELRGAVETLEKAREECRALHYEHGVAATTNNLGALHTRLGNYDEALRYHLQSIEIERSLGRTIGIANNLNLMGNIHADLGNYDRAKDLYQEALALYEELGQLPGISQALGNIGNIFEDQGANEQALQYFERALEVAREAGQPTLEAGPLTNMGIVFRNLGQYEKALECHRKAVEIREETGERSRLAVTLLNMGEVLLLAGRLPEAVDTLERVREDSEELGMSTILEAAVFNLAEARARLGHYDRAHALLAEYVELHQVTISEEHHRTVSELQARYDADRKREEIKLLTKDNEIKALQLSRARLTAVLTLIVAGFIVGVAALLLRRYRSLLAFWKKKVFIGPYRVGEEIDSGGMGVVYKATNVLKPGRTIALKVIRDELAGDATQRQRFINEGQIIDSLNHPNIVTVYDRGEHNERLYIAMEYLGGRTLSEVFRSHVAQGKAVDEEFCRRVMGQLADAVSAIHDQNIVHRDIKPNNVVVNGDDGERAVAKLLDFGAAKIDTMTTITAPGELIGTVSYLPPERIRHHEPSSSGDVFSLGVVFYELLTLVRPFPAEDPVDLIRQILELTPPEPSSLRVDLDHRLNTLVMAMLDKDPCRRPSGGDVFRCVEQVSTAAMR